MTIYGGRLNYAGVRALMREPGVRDELMRRMQRVASRANSEAYMDPRPPQQLPVARVGGNLWEEADTGYLSSAIDAAGGA